MKKQAIGYSLTTTLFCLAMVTGGTMSELRAEIQKESIYSPSYLDYLITIL